MKMTVNYLVKSVDDKHACTTYFKINKRCAIDRLCLLLSEGSEETTIGRETQKTNSINEIIKKKGTYPK